MIIKFPQFENWLDFEDNASCSLIIKNQAFFRKVIVSLLDACRYGEDSDYVVLQHNDVELSLSKNLLLITDIYSFDFSSRALLNSLYKNVSRQASGEFDINLVSINQSVCEVLESIRMEYGLDLVFKEGFDLIDVLKMMDVRLAIEGSTSVVDRLYDIINLSSDLLNKEVICLINQRSWLSNNELAKLVDYANYKHQKLMFIDNLETECQIGESQVVVDQDMYDFKNPFKSSANR